MEVARVNEIYKIIKSDWPGNERACAVKMLREKGLNPVQ
jgi:hypothetical protein